MNPNLTVLIPHVVDYQKTLIHHYEATDYIM